MTTDKDRAMTEAANRVELLRRCAHALRALDAGCDSASLTLPGGAWSLAHLLQQLWGHIPECDPKGWPDRTARVLGRAGAALRDLYWGAQPHQVHPGGLMPLLAECIAELRRCGVRDPELERLLGESCTSA